MKKNFTFDIISRKLPNHKKKKKIKFIQYDNPTPCEEGIRLNEIN